MPNTQQTIVNLGAYHSTQCYFSKYENDVDDKGELQRRVSRTDTVYTYFIYRTFSDHRPSQLLARPLGG